MQPGEVAPPPSPPRDIEKRRATRVPRRAPAQLIFWPAARNSAPIDVTIVDYSVTGIGIVHGETLPPGQKFIVREPFVTSGSTCIYTVVRSDRRGDGTYSIGLHIGNTMENKLEPVEDPPRRLSRLWRFIYFLFVLVGTILVVSAVLLRQMR